MGFDIVKEMGNLAAIGQNVGTVVSGVNSYFDKLDQAAAFNEFARLKIKANEKRDQFFKSTVGNQEFRDYENLDKLYSEFIQTEYMPLVEESTNPYAKEAMKNYTLQSLEGEAKFMQSVSQERRARLAVVDYEKNKEEMVRGKDLDMTHDYIMGAVASGIIDERKAQMDIQDMLYKTNISQVTDELAKAMQGDDPMAFDAISKAAMNNPMSFKPQRGGAEIFLGDEQRKMVMGTIAQAKESWRAGKVQEQQAGLQQQYRVLLDHYYEAVQSGRQTDMNYIQKEMSSFTRSRFPEVAEEAIKLERSLLKEMDRTAMSADQRKVAENRLADLQVKYEMGEINGNQVKDAALAMVDEGLLEMKDVRDAMDFSSKPRMMERLPEVKTILEQYPDRNSRAAVARAVWGLSKNGMDVNAVTTPAGLKSIMEAARLANERALKEAMAGRTMITEQDRQWNNMTNRENGKYIAQNAEAYKIAMRNPSGREQEINNLRMFSTKTNTELSRLGMNVTATNTFSDDAMPIFKIQPPGEANKNGFIRPSYDTNGNRTWYFGTAERTTTTLIGNDEALSGWYGRTDAQRTRAAQNATRRTAQ